MAGLYTCQLDLPAHAVTKMLAKSLRAEASSVPCGQVQVNHFGIGRAASYYNMGYRNGAASSVAGGGGPVPVASSLPPVTVPLPAP